jgi:hypothetical protein
VAPKILSRAREQDAAARFLDAIAEGPTALVLAGPAGIGKTTLCGTPSKTPEGATIGS